VTRPVVTYRQCLATLGAELAELDGLNARLQSRDRGKFKHLPRTCDQCGRALDVAEILSGGVIASAEADDFDISVLWTLAPPRQGTLLCRCGRTLHLEPPLRRGASELSDERRRLFHAILQKLEAAHGLSPAQAMAATRFIVRYRIFAPIQASLAQAADGAPDMPLIRLEGIRKRYRLGAVDVEALRGIDLSIDEGEIVALVGPSGAGKSTLLNILGCIDRPTSGRIVLGGTDAALLTEDQRADLRNQRIGFVFQSFNLLPVLDVYENVELPLLARRGLSAAERRERVLQVLDDVDLGRYAKQRPDQLSGGQRQRVAVARAMVIRPSVIIADEPTANLDSESAHRMLNLMVEMNELRRVTLIISTHDERVMNHVGRFVRIKDGRVGVA
jgi:putative ABC transport system ATP-binding protein